MISLSYCIVTDKDKWASVCESNSDYKELCEIYESLQKFVTESIDWEKVTKEHPIILSYETPYFDKDYLSTFYAYHAKKFVKQSRLCARLHFYRVENGLNSRGILPDGRQPSSYEDIEKLNLTYLGYIVLRPNENGLNIGRSYVVPSLCTQRDLDLILGDFSGNILGKRFSWKSFPYMMQEGDFDVCAHIAVWTIVRYYGSNYRAFADTVLGDIVVKAHKNYGRGVVSTGLNIQQVADLMAVHSHIPIIVKSKDFDQTGLSFRNELLTYVESAIPFVGFLSYKEHALAVMGHTKPDYQLLQNPFFCRQARVTWSRNYIHDKNDFSLPLIDYASLISGLVVMDDNKTPYREIFDQVDCVYDTENNFRTTDYGIQNIDAAIVPFHRDMQFGYPAAVNAVKNIFYQCWEKINSEHKSCEEKCDDGTLLISYEKLGFASLEQDVVFRIFLASSNTLKEHFREVLENNRINYSEDDIFRVQTILYSNLPKFVWCIEISTVEEITDESFSGLIIIDSTAGTYNYDPWLHIQGTHAIYAKAEDGSFYEWEVKPLSSAFPKFDKNLN